MFSKYDYLIKKRNSRGIRLKGYHSKINNEKCAICFSGLCGGCDKVFSSIAEKCIENNISFLFGETTACHSIREYSQTFSDGSEKTVMKGGTFENFDETINDMLFWINFAIQEGYADIYLIGHSLACNRIIKMINTKLCREFKKIVLISPQDIAVQIDKEMYNEAVLNIQQKKFNDILSKKMFGFCDISSKTYYDMMTRTDINNLPYLTPKGNFSMLENIKLPFYGIIGDNDQGLEYSNLSAIDIMEIIKKHCDNFRYTIIKGATHSFNNFENEVADAVVKYLVNDDE